MRWSPLVLVLVGCGVVPCEHAEETYGVVGDLHPASFAEAKHEAYSCDPEDWIRGGASTSRGPWRGDSVFVELVSAIDAGSELAGTGAYGGAVVSVVLDGAALARGEADWTAEAVLTSRPGTEVPLVDGDVRLIGRPDVFGEPGEGQWNVDDLRLAWDLTFDLGDGAVHLHYWGQDVVTR